MPSWALLPLTLTIWGLSRRVDATLENIGLGLILASLGGWGSMQKRDSYLKWVRGWKWLWMTVGQLPMIFSEFFLRKLFDQNHLVTLQRRRCNVENSLFSLINVQDSISYPSSQRPQRDLKWVLIPMMGSEKNPNGCGCPQWHDVWPVGGWVSENQPLGPWKAPKKAKIGNKKVNFSVILGPIVAHSGYKWPWDNFGWYWPNKIKKIIFYRKSNFLGFSVFGLSWIFWSKLENGPISPKLAANINLTPKGW